MKMNWTAALSEAGVDTETALNRFSGNAALYRKFLIMFPQDDTFEKLGPALENEDWASALAAAHTLKGVAGNLGLTPLFDACGDMVSLLRARKYKEAAGSYRKLEQAYEKLVAIISEEG